MAVVEELPAGVKSQCFGMSVGFERAGWIGSASWEEFARRTASLWLPTEVEGAKLPDTSLFKIVVTRLSGESFEAQLVGSAVINDVKKLASSHWRVPADVHKVVFKTRVVADEEAVASLATNHGADRLNMMLINTDVAEIERKIEQERSQPVTLESRERLEALVDELEAFESTFLPLALRLPSTQ